MLNLQKPCRKIPLRVHSSGSAVATKSAEAQNPTTSDVQGRDTLNGSPRRLGSKPTDNKHTFENIVSHSFNMYDAVVNVVSMLPDIGGAVLAEVARPLMRLPEIGGLMIDAGILACHSSLKDVLLSLMFKYRENMWHHILELVCAIFDAIAGLHDPHPESLMDTFGFGVTKLVLDGSKFSSGLTEKVVSFLLTLYSKARKAVEVFKDLSSAKFASVLKSREFTIAIMVLGHVVALPAVAAGYIDSPSSVTEALMRARDATCDGTGVVMSVMESLIQILNPDSVMRRIMAMDTTLFTEDKVTDFLDAARALMAEPRPTVADFSIEGMEIVDGFIKLSDFTERASKLITQGNDLARVHGPRVVPTLRELDEFVKARVNMVLLAPRVDPVGVIFVGPAGTGKSSMVGLFSKAVHKRLGIEEVVGMISERDKYFNHASSHDTVWEVDDVGQAGEASDMAMIKSDITKVISSLPYSIVRAELAEKKAHFFRGALVILTSNYHFGRLHEGKTGNSPSAIARRFIEIQVSVKPAFRKDGSAQLDPSKVQDDREIWDFKLTTYKAGSRDFDYQIDVEESFSTFSGMVARATTIIMERRANSLRRINEDAKRGPLCQTCFVPYAGFDHSGCPLPEQEAETDRTWGDFGDSISVVRSPVTRVLLYFWYYWAFFYGFVCAFFGFFYNMYVFSAVAARLGRTVEADYISVRSQLVSQRSSVEDTIVRQKLFARSLAYRAFYLGVGGAVMLGLWKLVRRKLPEKEGTVLSAPSLVPHPASEEDVVLDEAYGVQAHATYLKTNKLVAFGAPYMSRTAKDLGGVIGSRTLDIKVSSASSATISAKVWMYKSSNTFLTVGHIFKGPGPFDVEVKRQFTTRSPFRFSFQLPRERIAVLSNDIAVFTTRDMVLPKDFAFGKYVARVEEVGVGYVAAVSADDGPVLKPIEVKYTSGSWSTSSGEIMNGAYTYPLHGHGLCGTPLVVPAHNGKGAVVTGIHIAGVAGTGYAVPLDREEIDSAIGQLTGVVPESEAKFTFTSEIGNISQRSFLHNIDQVSADSVNFTPLGTLLRGVPPKPESSYHDLGTFTDELGIGIPNFKGFYDEEAKEWVGWDIVSVKGLASADDRIRWTLFTERLKGWAKNKGMSRPYALPQFGVVDYKYAINGIGALPGLDMKTSGGMGMSGPKSQYFDRVSEDPAIYEMKPELEKDVLNLEKAYRNGERVRVPMKVFPKDEPRKLSKIENREIRKIAGAPVAFCIQVRKYFLGVQQFLLNNRDTFGFALGVNPYGEDWGHIAQRLGSIGFERVMAGDFKGFDASISGPAVQHAFDFMIWIAEEYLGYSPGDLAVMQLIAMDVRFHELVYHGVDSLFCWTGNPSGQPLTSFVNCIINLTIHLEAHGWERGGFVGYFLGDDCLAVSRHIDQFRVQEVAESLGFQYTTADKEAVVERFTGIEKATFLKRSFRFNDDLGRWTSPLEVSSVKKMLSFWRAPSYSSEDEKNILFRSWLRDVILNASREMALHGPETYAEFDRILATKAFLGESRNLLPYSDMLKWHREEAVTYCW